MKNKKTLSCLFVCLTLLFSCETEDVSTENQSTTNSKSNLAKNGDSRSFGEVEPEVLHHHLQWVSFIAAEAILLDEAARVEFLTKISTNGKASLEDLIGADVSDESAFKIAFNAILTHNVCIDVSGGCGRPGTVTNTPPRPSTGGIGGGGGILPGLEVEMAVAAFKNFALNENCLELYLNYDTTYLTQGPNITKITSTAHPLDTSNYNSGIKRITYYESAPVDVIDNAYMQNFLTLIARPFRPATMGTTTECSYSEFSEVTNFADFPH